MIYRSTSFRHWVLVIPNPLQKILFNFFISSTVFNVFDRHAVKVPFVHADLTRPERLLRNRLQQICQQKNAGRFSSAVFFNLFKILFLTFF